MLKSFRIVVVLVALLIGVAAIALPAQAQDAPDPATFVPSSAGVYVELDASEAGQADLQSLVRLILTVTTTEMQAESGAEDASFAEFFRGALPEISYQDDIAPWLGDRIALAFLGDDNGIPSTNTTVIALPIGDEAAFAEHQDAIIATLEESRMAAGSETPVYTNEFGFMQVAFVPGAVVLATPDAMEILLAQYLYTGADDVEMLADNTEFTHLRGLLPQDALFTTIMSGSSLRTIVGEQQVSGINQALELTLRFNPAESEIEDALIAADWLGGVGFGVEYAADRIDVTAIATVDAQYAAPQLPSDTAGARLLSLIPGDSVLVFDSYDLTLSSGALSLAFLGPAIGETFSSIVNDLNASGTPAPTPTPPPTPTVDELIAQTEPAIAEIESQLGVSLEEVFTLLSGEYAVAVFGGLDGALLGTETGGYTGAFWLQTSDPTAVVGLMDTIIEGALVNSSPGDSPTSERRKETDGDSTIITWSDASMGGDLLSYGTIGTDIFFLTPGESAPLVVSTSLGDGVLPQSPNYPEDIVAEFGSGQEALLYVDTDSIAELIFDPRVAQLDSIVATVDVAPDGVFMARVTVLLPGE